MLCRCAFPQAAALAVMQHKREPHTYRKSLSYCFDTKPSCTLLNMHILGIHTWPSTSAQDSPPQSEGTSICSQRYHEWQRKQEKGMMRTFLCRELGKTKVSKFDVIS